MTTGPSAALLMLEDGTALWGEAIGMLGETFGELVFNTGMTGYQEVLTDPSYCGQIVVMTYPEVGIYGVNPEDVESGHVQVSGYVVQRAVRPAFNQRARAGFADYLREAAVIAIEGVDTRALTRHLRRFGAMRGAISSIDLSPEHLLERVRRSPSMAGRALVGEVATSRSHRVQQSPGGGPHVVVVDLGAKWGIGQELRDRGAAVSVVPYNTDIRTVLELRPDGVLISNGPGDPEPLHDTIRLIQSLLEHRVPVAGICLGHQLLGLAVGGRTYKMRFGHRGANHPVKDLACAKIAITTQNHGFAVDPTSLGIGWAPLDATFHPARPELAADMESQSGTMAERLPRTPLVGASPLGHGPVEVTHLSLNDGTVEGLRLQALPAFSVQYHPEASPGPHDTRGFFDDFLTMIRTEQLHA